MSNLSERIQNTGTGLKEAADGFCKAVEKYITAFKKFREVYKIYKLKRKADKLAKKSKVQHFIIMWHGKPEILSKDGFTLMRQRGVFPLSFTATELKKIAIYQTGK